MNDDQTKPGSEAFARLQQQFWRDWWAVIEGAAKDVPASPWSQAADFGSDWFKSSTAVPHGLFDALASQGRAFLSLCEQAGGDQAEWLDRWLDAIQRSGDMSAGLCKLPEVLSSGMEPLLQAFQAPVLGFSRERQTEFQSFLHAQGKWQQANTRYLALLAPLPADTAGRLRYRLASMEEQPGRGIDSLRQLYDLWVDAAEEAFSELAFSDEYRAVYGELINATMRLRKTAGALMAPQLKMLGIPTSAELDEVSRQLHELRREVAGLKRSRPHPAKKRPNKKTAKRAKKKTKAA